MAKIKTPKISAVNIEELHLSIEKWLEDMQLEILPFIAVHATHKALLKSNNFYFPFSKAEENPRKAFLRSKIEQ